MLHLYAPYVSITVTTRSTPTKLVDNLTHIPINISIAAICAILGFFNEKGDFYAIAKFVDDDESSPAKTSLEGRLLHSIHQLPPREVGPWHQGDGGEGGSFSSANGEGVLVEEGQGPVGGVLATDIICQHQGQG
jgi:hypothetical protein